MIEVPAGKKLNGFTDELEDAEPLNLAPSPTDQRLLASPDTPDDRPLIDQVRDRVANDTARNVKGNVLVDQETPVTDITTSAPRQLIDVPATNTVLREEGHQVAPIEEPVAPVAAVSPNATTPDDDSQQEPVSTAQADNDAEHSGEAGESNNVSEDTWSAEAGGSEPVAPTYVKSEDK
jgi:hypothetical protein